MAANSKQRLGVDGVARSPSSEDQLNQVFAEVFSTPSGQAVLKHLRSITIESVGGPDIIDTYLRHLEGQRFLVGLIEQRVAKGQRSKNK